MGTIGAAFTLGALPVEDDRAEYEEADDDDDDDDG